MSMKTVIVAAVIAFAMMAGCASKAPSGTLADLGHSPAVSGGATLLFQPASGRNAAGGAPGVGGTLECAQPDPVSPFVPPCKDPYTLVVVNATLPKAGDLTYSVFLVNATAELKVADLSEGNATGSTARYAGTKNFTEDMSGRYTVLELRLGGFLLADAAAQPGPVEFKVAAATHPVVTGLAYVDHTLSGNVTGLQENATYQGNLYLPGPNGTVQRDAAESFEIRGNGPISYTSTDHAIGDFAEFHIHVGHSKVNLYKASIPKVES